MEEFLTKSKLDKKTPSLVPEQGFPDRDLSGYDPSFFKAFNKIQLAAISKAKHPSKI